MNSLELTKIAVAALEDKKGIDIKVIDIRNISVITDYFIIATGNNINQVKTLSENVEEMLEKAGKHVKQIEGYRSGDWILMDYNDIIVHVFNEEGRGFYNLEKIWKDGVEVDINSL